MLIFDSFPTEGKAKEFIEYLDREGRSGVLCMTEEKARTYDVFPFSVVPPIVMVDREIGKEDWIAKESRIVQVAISVFGGEFAGT